MGLHPRDFRLEQADPFAQFILRIGIKHFACQLAGEIKASARAIIFVHCRTESTRLALLSTVPAARAARVTVRQQGLSR